MFEAILEQVHTQTPLVHNITNYVTVNDCANIALACGGSPIMADDSAEVEEITSICNALVLNIGTLNSRTVDAMLKAGKQANVLSHPVVFDPVGAGASALRTETAQKILSEIKVAVIRGNVSEIKTLAAGHGNTKGVDADVGDAVTENNLAEMAEFCRAFSEKTGAVISMSGAIDLIADAKMVYAIRNGHPMMSKITGTGCMLSTMTGVYCGANPEQLMESAACAAAVMGLAGECAWERVQQENGGTASLRLHLIDAVSNMTAERLNGGMKFEGIA